jgi:hypothetical protein
MPKIVDFFKNQTEKNKISSAPNFFLNRSTPTGTTGTKPHV